MTRKSGILLTDGREVYQSFGGRLLLKTGGLQTALSHLVYRGVDEIVLCMGSKNTFKYCYWEQLYRTLHTQYIGVPVTLIGGFASRKLDKFLESGIVERLGVNSSLFSSDPRLSRVQEQFGKQFLLAHIPIRVHNNEIELIDFSENKYVQLSDDWVDHLNSFDEISIHEISSHGASFSRDCCSLVNKYFDSRKIIFSGGVNSSADITEIMRYRFAAILIDNSILYDERRL